MRGATDAVVSRIMGLGRIMGLDIGTRRVGVALTDVTRSIASPHATIANRGVRRLVAELVELAGAEQVALAVVGHPLQADGKPGAAARLPERVAEALLRAGLAVQLWDECYTTVAADRLLATIVPAQRARAKGMADRIAAALILQSYLEAVGAQTAD